MNYSIQACAQAECLNRLLYSARPRRVPGISCDRLTVQPRRAYIEPLRNWCTRSRHIDHKRAPAQPRTARGSPVNGLHVCACDDRVCQRAICAIESLAVGWLQHHRQPVRTNVSMLLPRRAACRTGTRAAYIHYMVWSALVCINLIRGSCQTRARTPERERERELERRWCRAASPAEPRQV